MSNFFVNDYSSWLNKINSDVLEQHHAIKGVELFIERRFSERSIIDANIHPDEIKEKLCQLLVEEMKKSNMIEYTRCMDPYTNETIFRARIFAVPNSDVQLLRTVGVIK
jgi:hypothetical protein